MKSCNERIYLKKRIEYITYILYNLIRNKLLYEKRSIFTLKTEPVSEKENQGQ